MDSQSLLGAMLSNSDTPMASAAPGRHAPPPIALPDELSRLCEATEDERKVSRLFEMVDAARKGLLPALPGEKGIQWLNRQYAVVTLMDMVDAIAINPELQSSVRAAESWTPNGLAFRCPENVLECGICSKPIRQCGPGECPIFSHR